MKTASAKAKGRNLQKWVRDKLINHSGGLLSDQDVRSTSMGAGGEDILLSSMARNLFPFSFECKSKAKFAGYAILDQAKENAPEGAEPVAVVKANHRKPLILIDADYFIKMYSGYP